jgi:hypothetical protein
MGERPLSDFAVYRARPTVRVNGSEQAMLSELIVAMTMTESEGGMSALELKVPILRAIRKAEQRPLSKTSASSSWDRRSRCMAATSRSRARSFRG